MGNDMSILQGVLNGCQDGLALIDTDGFYKLLNPGHSRATGLPDEVFINRNIKDIHKRGYFAFNPVSAIALEKGRPTTGFQRLSTGKEVLVRSTPLVDNGGCVTAVVSTVLDILDVCNAKCNPDLKRSTPDHHDPVQVPETEIIALSSPMMEVLATARYLAATNANVLIRGETGVGKEVIAELIHRESGRKGEFITVTCTALPKDIAEAELFGYEKGAFTGASTSGKRGLLELGHDGTVFLDEIGDLPLELQGKLLRVVEKREAYRVGGLNPLRINTRFVAATNRHLEQMVAEGTFRSDLYYRLNTASIFIPPLRERQADIIPLFNYYMNKIGLKAGKVRTLTSEAGKILENYQWPGNVRELINLVERLIIFGRDGSIGLDELTRHMGSTLDPSTETHYLQRSLKQAISELEINYLRWALTITKSSREISRLLGLSHTAVLQKLRKYNLAPHSSKSGRPALDD